MAISIHMKIIAGVVSAAVLVTAVGAGQARAEQNYNAERAIAAIIGLAVIGSIFSDELGDLKDRNRKHDAHQRSRTHKPGYIERRHAPGRHKTRGFGHRKYALPERCVRRVRAGRGDVLIYGKRCMNRHYRYSGHLPRRCEREFRTDRGWRQGWSAHCLRREGFRTARR